MGSRWRIRHKLSAGLLLVVGMTCLLTSAASYGLYSYSETNRCFQYYQQQLSRLTFLLYTVDQLYMPDAFTLADAQIETVRKVRISRVDQIQRGTDLYRRGLESGIANSFSEQSMTDQNKSLDQLNKLLTQLRNEILMKPATAEANRPIQRPTPQSWTHEKYLTIQQITKTVHELKASIESEIAHHIDTAGNNYRASLAIVLTSSVMVLIMLVIFLWLGYRAVFFPLRQLHSGVTKLASGNFDSRVHLDSGDEMQELSESFNAMADRLQGIYQELNQKVEERSRQLIRSERLASVGFLAAGVAHEINNPLASIAFCGEAIESRLKPVLQTATEDNSVVANYLRMIQQEAFRCKAITEKLLDFSRVGDPERSETDLVGLARSVIEMVQHLGKQKNNRIVFNPAQSVYANVNPQELKQVLLNLVVNALDALNEGGTVEILVLERNGVPEIKVKDNGIGMTEEVLQNLFEPFFTRNRTGKGTGLGLSISHLIVSQHGGTLDVASDGPNKGSTFTIRLPAEKPQPIAMAA